MKHDPVHSPEHYTHPTGIECKEITYGLPTWLGSAIKYIWRADKKGQPVQDREKAIECLNYATINSVNVLGHTCSGLELDLEYEVAKYSWSHRDNTPLALILGGLCDYLDGEADGKYFLQIIKMTAHILSAEIEGAQRGEEDD